MKLKTLFLATLAILVVFSCKREEEVSSGSNGRGSATADAQNETEERIIPVSELKTGITIEGASTVTGTPPAPTGTVDFQIETTDQEGIQQIGYTISFSSNDQIDGAYIIFKDTEGNRSDEYYDVPVSTTEKRGVKEVNNKKYNRFNVAKTSAVEEYEIDVDFGISLEPGQFCYEICIYDASGNISQIQQICVEVEAWGGNSTIVGKWKFDRVVPEDEPYLETISCQGGGTIEVESFKYTKEDWTFVLEADGDYYEIYDNEYQELDYEATETGCTEVFDPTIIEENFKYYGKWSFNEDDGTLTNIDLGYEDFINPEQNEVFPEGAVYFEGVEASVVNGELVLTDNNGSEPFTLYFTKK